MRIVADTNTVVSGLLWQGPPRRIVDWGRDQTLTLCTSPALLAELEEVLGRRKFKKRLRNAGLSAEALFQDFARIAVVTEAVSLPQPVCRDPDDDQVLACALAAQAEFIVSGDGDLLTLKSFQGMPIVTAVEMVETINAENRVGR